MKKAEADDDRRAVAAAAPTSGTRSRTGSTSPASGLSGGQQQRLCIARAIAVEPQVLLMDEPCSALDPISTSAIEDLIHELKTDYTIVIVTHNMQQAARVSDDTGFFNLKAAGEPGQLVEFNPTQKIFSNPDERGHRGLHLRPLRLSPLPACRRGGPERPGCPIGGSDPQGVPGHPCAFEGLLVRHPNPHPWVPLRMTSPDVAA